MNIIKEMNNFFSIDEIQEELNEMKKNDFDFDCHETFDKDVKRVLRLPLMLKELDKISSLSEKNTGVELDVVFLATSSLTNEIFYLWGIVQLLGMNFLKRNESLCETFNQEGVIYEIAGKTHLQKKPSLLGIRKGVDKVETALKNKKYVILFPTKSREKIEHIETQYVETALESPPPKQICISITENGKKNRKLKIQIEKKLNATLMM